MSEAAWPIRVGGEYENRDLDYKDIVRRVTHVDDRIVRYTPIVKGFEMMRSDVTPSCFRRMCLPEKNDPIPDLIAAGNALAALCGDYNPEAAAWKAAVAKAEGGAL